MRALRHEGKYLTLCEHCGEGIIEYPLRYCKICGHKNRWPFWVKLFNLLNYWVNNF